MELFAKAYPDEVAFEALWKSVLGALAAEAINGEQILFSGAGPYLQIERPVDVALAILQDGASR